MPVLVAHQDRVRHTLFNLFASLNLLLLAFVSPHSKALIHLIDDCSATLRVHLVRDLHLITKLAAVVDDVYVYVVIQSKRTHTINEVLLSVVVVLALNNLHE